MGVVTVLLGVEDRAGVLGRGVVGVFLVGAFLVVFTGVFFAWLALLDGLVNLFVLDCVRLADVGVLDLVEEDVAFAMVMRLE